MGMGKNIGSKHSASRRGWKHLGVGYTGVDVRALSYPRELGIMERTNRAEDGREEFYLEKGVNKEWREYSRKFDEYCSKVATPQERLSYSRKGAPVSVFLKKLFLKSCDASALKALGETSIRQRAIMSLGAESLEESNGFYVKGKWAEGGSEKRNELFCMAGRRYEAYQALRDDFVREAMKRDGLL